MIQMLSSLAGIIALIIIAAFVLKKFTRFTNKNSGNLNIVSSLSLGTKEKLVVVEVADKQLLLGVTNHSINTLHVLSEPMTLHKKPATTKPQEANA